MKCLYFVGNRAAKTVDAYNKWAANKTLARDVIVHSHVIQPSAVCSGAVTILVFFDERMHPDWIGQSPQEETMQ